MSSESSSWKCRTLNHKDFPGCDSLAIPRVSYKEQIYCISTEEQASHISLKCVLSRGRMARWSPETTLSSSAGGGWGSAVRLQEEKAGGRILQSYVKTTAILTHAPGPVGEAPARCQHQARAQEAAHGNFMYPVGTSTPSRKLLVLERALQKQENKKQSICTGISLRHPFLSLETRVPSM